MRGVHTSVAVKRVQFWYGANAQKLCPYRLQLTFKHEVRDAARAGRRAGPSGESR
jgi:hypothetical protein